METPSTASERAATLLAVVQAAAKPEARQWLDGCWFIAGRPFSRPGFASTYAGAARRAPGAVSALTDADRARLEACGIVAPERWSLSDVLRAALLLRAIEELSDEDGVGLATELFRRGDSAERVALLRALPLLPSPARFTALAIEACRSHVLDVFAAIACDNPFPAAHFPELNFNQLVIKTLFMELPLARVFEWQQRANPELRRIAGDYAAERRAAGRSVPEDIALIQSTEDHA